MVELKPFDLQHIDTHYKWNNNPELTFLDSEYPHKHESFDSFLKRMKKLLEDQTTTTTLMEVFDKNTNKLIGVVDIHAIDRHNKRCFIQITIGVKEHCNRESMNETLNKVLKQCFVEMGMHKVAATSFDFNHSWIEIIEQAGFVQEGVLRDHVLKNDTYRDKYIFGMLKSEYEQIVTNSSKEAVNV